MDITGQFAEKYLVSRQAAVKEKPAGGQCGYELEWNLLDSQMRPLLTVGRGPSQLSFVDYLRGECIQSWFRQFIQLEVFHWMIEWATRPYYLPRGAVYESRLMEATLINGLEVAGEHFGERLHYWYGNLLYLTDVGTYSIPDSWHLAKRRYLERCVNLYGAKLATAGIHTNLSLPEPLLAWDFVHLPASERGGVHLDEYKNQVYITATRLMRAFTGLFLATSAATPLKAEVRRGNAVVVLTENDSVRNLTFPNPGALDVPDLYRSYNDYLNISYELVRSGVRFGNNNWTPVRARSFAEPVERLIAVTSEQLGDLYARGLYSVGSAQPVEDMARQIENQNLMARINLPMARVEVRTDDGGHPVDVEIANLTFKHLLLLRFYSDPEFARAFRYDREDIARARRNEEKAALYGLRVEIENPLTGKPVRMREFLTWALEEVSPLAYALGMRDDLEPLHEMARGGPNTAERLRLRLRKEMGVHEEVPIEILEELEAERKVEVRRDVEKIAETFTELNSEALKLGEFLQRGRDSVRDNPQLPITFQPRPEAVMEAAYPDKTSEVVALAQQLIRIPSVTACPVERLDEVRRAAALVYDYLCSQGLEARYFDRGKYPAVLAGFPDNLFAPVMLSGHFDVVSPEPDESQFETHIEGDYLWGRGAADMKTVLATNLVWLKDMLRIGPPYPPINLLMVGNEENGEAEPMGTPHVLSLLKDESGYIPRLLVAGERTGEKGNELWGEICIKNRGVMRFDLVLRGQKGHSGVAGAQVDLTERLIAARTSVADILRNRLTLNSPDRWQSQMTFPFIQVGTQGVYNVTADKAVMGVEVRPIPEDDLTVLVEELQEFCDSQAVELKINVKEAGIACDPQNTYLVSLIQAVKDVSKEEPRLGKKLPGTSARFAPGGQGVVWGQTGIGPHAREERHYIPSILPYYQALVRYSELLQQIP